MGSEKNDYDLFTFSVSYVMALDIESSSTVKMGPEILQLPVWKTLSKLVFVYFIENLILGTHFFSLNFGMKIG